jgi:hypothetical protein
MRKIKVAIIATVLSWADLAGAAQPNPASSLFLDFGAKTPTEVIVTLIQAALGLIGLVSMLYLIIGGYQYMLSGANPDLAAKGLKTVKGALTGLIIVILSYVIVIVVINSFMGI